MFNHNKKLWPSWKIKIMLEWVTCWSVDNQQRFKSSDIYEKQMGEKGRKKKAETCGLRLKVLMKWTHHSSTACHLKGSDITGKDLNQSHFGSSWSLHACVTKRQSLFPAFCIFTRPLEMCLPSYVLLTLPLNLSTHSQWDIFFRIFLIACTEDSNMRFFFLYDTGLMAGKCKPS